MKKNVGPKIIALVVVLIMLLPIVIDAVTNSILVTIKYDELKNVTEETANYDFALVYVAPKDKEGLDDEKTSIKELTAKYKSSNNKELKSYYMNYTDLSESAREEIFKDDSKENEAYMFLVNGEMTKTITGSLDENELKDYVEFYSANAEEIPEKLVHYGTPEDSKDFTKMSKDKNKVYMFVFGRDSCFYCNQFKIVYNTVAEEYDLDEIYYIDSESFDKEEYQKILDSGLTIPKKCSSTGEEVKLQSGFGTPLTLFTKNGKTLDCINGYTNKKNLITQLKTLGILEDEK